MYTNCTLYNQHDMQSNTSSLGNSPVTVIMQATIEMERKTVSFHVLYSAKQIPMGLLTCHALYLFTVILGWGGGAG